MQKFDIALLPELPDLSFEALLWSEGVQFIAGIDEAGRGALAGPVAVAAVILPPDPDIPEDLAGVKDSKLMTPLQRTKWAERIREMALAWGIGFASHLEIDEIGIVPATHLAAQRALEQLQVSPQHVLLDYIVLPDYNLPQTSLIKGDSRSLSIAAASVLAKTARDALMCQIDIEYPDYGFAEHKGYTTRRHLEVLNEKEPSPVHRRSYYPINGEKRGEEERPEGLSLEELGPEERPEGLGLEENATE